MMPICPNSSPWTDGISPPRERDMTYSGNVKHHKLFALVTREHAITVLGAWVICRRSPHGAVLRRVRSGWEIWIGVLNSLSLYGG